MQDDVRLELTQEWDSREELVVYLRQLASKVENNPLLADKQLYLHVERAGEDKVFYLMTL